MGFKIEEAQHGCNQGLKISELGGVGNLCILSEPLCRSTFWVRSLCSERLLLLLVIKRTLLNELILKNVTSDLIACYGHEAH